MQLQSVDTSAMCVPSAGGCAGREMTRYACTASLSYSQCMAEHDWLRHCRNPPQITDARCHGRSSASVGMYHGGNAADVTHQNFFLACLSPGFCRVNILT